MTSRRRRIERQRRRTRSSERGAGGRAERRRRVGPDRRSSTRLRHHSSDGDETETATLSIVDSDDGSIVEAQCAPWTVRTRRTSCQLWRQPWKPRNPKPGSVFVVGSTSAVCSVKSSLESLIPQPVIVPEEPEFALARGAALAAANVPGAEASTCGLAYSQDPDELAALDQAPVKLADADTQAALFDSIGSDDVVGPPHHGADPRVRIPIGSVAAATLVIGAVTLAMLVAANVQPAVDRDSIAAGVADSSALGRGARRPTRRRSSSSCRISSATTSSHPTSKHPGRDAHNGAASTRPTIAGASSPDSGTRRADPATCSITCDRSTSPGCCRKATRSHARCRRARAAEALPVRLRPQRRPRRYSRHHHRRPRCRRLSSPRRL